MMGGGMLGETVPPGGKVVVAGRELVVVMEDIVVCVVVLDVEVEVEVEVEDDKVVEVRVIW